MNKQASGSLISSISDILYKSVDPQHPIGNRLMKSLENGEKNAPEAYLIWAEKLFNKSTSINDAFAVAALSNIDIALDNYKLDKKLGMPFIRAAQIAEQYMPDNVIPILEKGLKELPSDSYITKYMAQKLLKNYQHQKVINLLEALPPEEICNPVIINLLGIAYYKNNDTDKAYTLLDNAMEEHPDNVDIIITFGNICITKREYQKAVNCFEFALSDKNHSGNISIERRLFLAKNAINTQNHLEN